MSVEHGPSRTPHCISCGDAIHDDGPEQTQAWLESMCEPCHEASEHSLRDHDAEAEAAVLAELADDTQRAEDAEAEYERRNADRTREYEPRSAF